MTGIRSSYKDATRRQRWNGLCLALHGESNVPFGNHKESVQTEQEGRFRSCTCSAPITKRSGGIGLMTVTYRGVKYESSRKTHSLVQ